MALFTKEQITEFIKNRPIRTEGALQAYKVGKEYIEDGDCYVRVTLPVWSQNESVTRDVLKFAYEANVSGATVYVRNSLIIVDFFISVCDPD